MSQTVYLCFRVRETDTEPAGRWIKMMPLKEKTRPEQERVMAEVAASNPEYYGWRLFTRSQWDKYLASDGWNRRRHKR